MSPAVFRLTQCLLRLQKRVASRVCSLEFGRRRQREACREKEPLWREVYDVSRVAGSSELQNSLKSDSNDVFRRDFRPTPEGMKVV